MSILSMKNVSVLYPGCPEPALQSIDLEVGQGEHLALVGPNGSGKTTLLHALVGLVPWQGSITIDGIELRKSTLQEVRALVGFLFAVADDQILFPRVIDDVRFGLRDMNHEAADREAHRLLHLLGIGDLADRSPHRLSLGQRKRVALAGALAGQPSLLLLDEPSGGLDPKGTAELAAVLRGLPCSIVMASHNLDFACRVSSRILLLDQGRIVAQESVGQSEEEITSTIRGLTDWFLHPNGIEVTDRQKP